MRNASALIACAAALCALVPPAASADHSARDRYCASAGAGDALPSGRQWQGLHTTNLSCRKGLALMKAFARRHSAPALGGLTDRIKGFRCRASFSYHAEGAYGLVVCRKGTRRAEWAGTGLRLGGGGAPD